MGVTCNLDNKRKEKDTETKNGDDDRNNEGKTNNVAISIGILNKISNSICKINVPNTEGTGFLIEILNKKYLMSNEHVIEKDFIEKNGIIKLTFKEDITKKIILDKNKRFIRDFTDKSIDVTIVEILEEDNIDQNNFLKPDIENIINFKKLMKKKIWIYEFQTEKLSQGEILKIDNYEFAHSASTEPGYSGSPVFLENSETVIAIHKQGSKTKKENYGDFLGPVYDFLIKNKIDENVEKINQLEEEIGKNENKEIIENNGDYYIGQFRNEAKNGKGKEYYKNGQYKYIGNFLNGKYEGLGKYIYKNGMYYLGLWKKGLKSGKGNMYYRDNTIFYGGYFEKDKYLGINKNIEKIN